MFIVTLDCFFSLIPFVNQNEFLWVFTWDQFWQSGIVITCICLFVCASALLIHAITHHTFQLKSLNLDWKIQNILVKNHIVLDADWPWPARLNFTSFQNAVYLHRFWNICETSINRVYSTSQIAPHIWPNRVAPWAVKQSSIFSEAIGIAGFCQSAFISNHSPYRSMCRGDSKVASYTGFQPAVQPSIGTVFSKLLSVFDKLYSPHMPKFYIPTFGNHWSNSKTAFFSLFCSTPNS